MQREREAAEINGKRSGQPFKIWHMPTAALGEEFGVDFSSISGNGLLDPRVCRAPIFKSEVVTTIIKHDGMIRWPKVLIEFDVTLPIESQVSSARRELKLQAKSQKHIKAHVAKFPNYLRMLDFQEIRVQDKEIGYHLFPGVAGRELSVKLRDTFAAAQHWQDDYRRLAAA
jgi:hypothetical protein